MENNVIWVFSERATGLIDIEAIGERNKRTVLTVSGDDYSEYKSALLNSKREKQKSTVCIFDGAVLVKKRVWAFVKDGINRTGSNPLRRLGTSAGKQFVDVSNLYQVPGGQEGIVITSLGERFEEGESLGNDICRDMQTLAIIAHDLDFKVFGIVLSIEEKWDKRDKLFGAFCGKYGL